MVFLSKASITNAQTIIAGQHGSDYHYVDIVPDSSMHASHNFYIPSFPIDMNGDGIIDFKLEARDQGGNGGSSYYTYVYVLNNNQVAVAPDDTCLRGNILKFAYAFQANDTIKATTTTWQSNIETNLSYYSWQLGWPSCWGNTFNDTTSNYIGVRVFLASDTLYGWIKVSGVTDIAFTLEEFACNLGTTGISDLNNQIHVNVYPNPTRDFTTVQTTCTGLSEINLYDITSRKVLHQEFVKSVKLNMATLPNGLYVYEVRDKSGYVRNGKIVKE